jgi:hypothetical protein
MAFIGSGPQVTNLNADNVASGTLAVARGGTGATTLTANNVLLGNGASAVQVVAPGTSGNVLTSNGTTWTSAALPAPSAPTTTQVLDATAGASAGAVGTYSWAYKNNAGSIAYGATVAGSSINPASTDLTSVNTGAAHSGTWRALGALAGTGWVTLCLRIS